MNLEASLHLPEADVLAHLKLYQVLSPVNDPQSSKWRKLANVTWKQDPVLGGHFFLMGHSRPLFHLFLSFQTNITIFTANKYEKMSIKCMVLGFELTTFGT